MLRLLFILLLPVFGFSQNKDSLYHLYEAKQFPALDALNTDISHPYYYFYKAVYANACNKPQTSLQNLKQFLGKKKKPEKEIAFAYYKLEHDNYVRNFQFTKAAQTGRQLLKKYSKEYEPDELKGNRYAAMIWEALQEQPLQRIEQPLLDSITFTRDLAGLINLKVKTENTESAFVFDTGAGLSTITDSYAEKLGLKILPDSGIYVSGFNNIYSPVRIGIAPKISFGNIVVYNEPFLIFKDEAFSFANGAYKINGIIGFPIAKELGRITIASKQLIIEKHEKDESSLEKNFFIETLHPILILTYKGKQMPFNFDTGANSSDFFQPFYNQDSTHLKAIGKYTTKTSASAGGATTLSVLEVPELEFELNGQKIIIPKPNIDPTRTHVSSDKLFGNIGQDLLRQYKKVVIDFGNSHFRLEN